MSIDLVVTNSYRIEEKNLPPFFGAYRLGSQGNRQFSFLFSMKVLIEVVFFKSMMLFRTIKDKNLSVVWCYHCQVILLKPKKQNLSNLWKMEMIFCLFVGEKKFSYELMYKVSFLE